MAISKKTVEALGWYGTSAILIAYALVSFSLIPSRGYIYQLLNLTGALSLVVFSLKRHVNQPAVLNTVWATVAFIAIINLLR